MIPVRFLRVSQLQRTLATFALLALVATIAACKSYIFLPVDVAYEKLSPPYVVSIGNETGAPFEVRPSRAGANAGYAVVRVPAGGTFKAILQLRRLTVGAGSSVAGAQVLDNPYFEQAGADQAELHLVQGDPHSLLIAIQHPSWFDEYVRQDAAPVELSVRLREFSRVPLFPRGPQVAP
jgi:hypothetical protein